MLFYRIENKSRIGCYQAAESNTILMSSSSRHPLPYEDSLLKNTMGEKVMTAKHSGEYRFGFCSVDQLLTWFYNEKWLTALHDEGFELSVYEIPACKYFMGNSQCVMAADAHTDDNLVERKSLLSLTKVLTQATLAL
jgi:hypothetical protein